MDDVPMHPETIALRAGYDPASGLGAAKPPLYMTSNFVFPDAQTAKDIHEAYFHDTGPQAGKNAHTYARMGHPNLDMLEARLAALDGAESAVVFNSGMAASAAIALSLVRPGDSVVHSRPIYGGTSGLYNDFLTQFGARVFAFSDGCDEADMRAAVGKAAAAGPLKLIVVESPANPTAVLVDLAMVRRIAGEVSPRPMVVCDNTLLGPLMQQPLAHGADLCMTSLSKYCGGHGDLLGGGVSGNVNLVRNLRLLRTKLGSQLDPHSCWLFLRSLETLPLRMERAAYNAQLIAEFLDAHPKVSQVTYPGLLAEGSPEHAVYQRQCKSGGSTFSFRVAGGEAGAFRFLDGLRLLRFALSLGGSDTLVSHPATSSQYAVPEGDRLAMGVDSATLRISVGIEHSDDLIADMDRALSAV